MAREEGEGEKAMAGTLVAVLAYLRGKAPGAFLSVRIAVLLWLILWVALGFSLAFRPSAVQSTIQPWIEVLNGATWPSSFGGSWSPPAFWMAGAVAARTVLNLAGPLAVVGVVYWLCNGGLERVMAMNIVEVLGVENDELIARVMAYIDTRHPGMLTDGERQFIERMPADLIKAWNKAGELKQFEEAV